MSRAYIPGEQLRSQKASNDIIVLQVINNAYKGAFPLTSRA